MILINVKLVVIMIRMRKLTIQTSKEKEVIDITNNLNEIIRDEDIQSGICVVNVLHTTTAVTTADLDPGTDLDMLDAFYNLVPKLDYRHPHDPSHVPDHILSTLIGTSVSLSVDDHKLILGKWQRVVLFEFNGPQTRDLAINLIT